MQVNQSQTNFGAARYSLNHRTDVPDITGRLKSEIDVLGAKYDIKSKLTGGIRCEGGECYCHNHFTTSKVVVSKKDKTPFEKVLHFFHLMPRATVTSVFDHNGPIKTHVATAQGIGDAKKAVKKFEGQA